jgi:hypothetical protein
MDAREEDKESWLVQSQHQSSAAHSTLVVLHYPAHPPTPPLTSLIQPTSTAIVVAQPILSFALLIQ